MFIISPSMPRLTTCWKHRRADSMFPWPSITLPARSRVAAGTSVRLPSPGKPLDEVLNPGAIQGERVVQREVGPHADGPHRASEVERRQLAFDVRGANNRISGGLRQVIDHRRQVGVIGKVQDLDVEPLLPLFGLGGADEGKQRVVLVATTDSIRQVEDLLQVGIVGLEPEEKNRPRSNDLFHQVEEHAVRSHVATGRRRLENEEVRLHPQRQVVHGVVGDDVRLRTGFREHSLRDVGVGGRETGPPRQRSHSLCARAEF